MVSDKSEQTLSEFKKLGGRLSLDVPMSRHTTMRVGGPAMALYEPQSVNDLIEVLRLCRHGDVSMQVIGSGSNIIVDDAGTKKILVKLTSPFFKKAERSDTELACGGGVLLNNLCAMAESSSLTGCEFLIGIPGTVGGAIFQNAGAYGRSMSDIIKYVKVIDSAGRQRVLDRKEAGFGYRSSRLKDFIIIGAAFCLQKSSMNYIKDKISRYMEERLMLQDYTAPSAGCIFKNPDNMDLSAGEMIDRCGLKGKRIGGAYVSGRHANFIVNKKSAKARDILQLIKLIKEKVNMRFDVVLEEEVEVIR
ncbi:MAG: UDP-N-acetylmuramate dehydrogenase [Candidatus Omnitrophota bacterium]